MLVAIGRFGPYIRHKNQFYSLGKTDDPFSITNDRAIEIIISKRNKEKEKIIREFPGDSSIKVLKGRFGAYIAQNKLNFKIPKGTAPENLTLDDCRKIIESAALKPVSKKKKK
jgi:DNA topoisomerase-1